MNFKHLAHRLFRAAPRMPNTPVFGRSTSYDVVCERVMGYYESIQLYFDYIKIPATKLDRLFRSHCRVGLSTGRDGLPGGDYLPRPEFGATSNEMSNDYYGGPGIAPQDDTDFLDARWLVLTWRKRRFWRYRWSRLWTL